MSILFLFLEFFVLGVVGIGLVETVGGVSHDHVEELFKNSQLKVFSEVASVDFVGPEGGEDFVDVESVFEFWVKLVGGTGDCNVAVESYQALG